MGNALGMDGNKQKPGTALITGAAHRIGRALAEDLAAHGWKIAIHCNTSLEPAQELAASLKNKGAQACVLVADLKDEEAVRRLIPEAANALGPVTCLVNNASVFESDSLEDATKESWALHMDVNLRAPFCLIQEFSKALPDGFKGNIVNVIDQRVWNLTADFASYTLSKAGLWTLTQTAALALAPNIRVNAIGPGPTLKSIHQSAQDFETEWRSVPLERKVSLEEICAALRFILDAESMTGQMIALDSGQHLGRAQAPVGPGTEREI